MDNDTIEDLAYSPEGGRVKKWLAGVIVAALPILVGVVGIKSGHTILIGKQVTADLSGFTAFWMSVAYIAVGAFLHFHFFWGLSQRLWRFSEGAKILAMLVFLPSFIYAIYRMIAGLN